VNLFDPLHSTNTWRIRGGVDFNFPQNISMGAAQSARACQLRPDERGHAGGFPCRARIVCRRADLRSLQWKLDNSSDTISLRRPDAPDTNGVVYIVVYEVDYKDSAPWPPSADGAGAALRRVNLGRLLRRPGHWVGAAPLSINLACSRAHCRPGRQPMPPRPPTSPFTVSRSAPAFLNYQWRKNGADIPGATHDSFTITDVQLPDEAAYTVVVGDLAGSVQSAPAYLFVYLVASLSVTQFPATQSVVSGGHITLSATLAVRPSIHERMAPPLTFPDDYQTPRFGSTDNLLHLHRAGAGQ